MIASGIKQCHKRLAERSKVRAADYRDYKRVNGEAQPPASDVLHFADRTLEHLLATHDTLRRVLGAIGKPADGEDVEGVELPDPVTLLATLECVSRVSLAVDDLTDAVQYATGVNYIKPHPRTAEIWGIPPDGAHVA